MAKELEANADWIAREEGRIPTREHRLPSVRRLGWAPPITTRS